MAEFLGSAVLEILADERGLDRGLASAGAKASGFQKRLSKVGHTMTTHLTLPIVAAGVVAVHMADEFDASMTKVSTLAGVNKDEIEGLSKSVLGLAKAYGKSPKELADALYFVESAGIHGAAALDVLTISAKASAVGLGDTKTVADAVTSAVNAYKDMNLTAAQAADVMIQTVREGKTSSEALAPVLGRLLPIGNELGISFAQVGASIAQMTRMGLSAAEAGTYLRGIMSALIKPSKGAEKALGGVGLSAAGLRKELKEKGVVAVLETLKHKFHGNIAELAKIFPNVRGLGGALALVGKAGGTTAGIFDRVKHSTGALNDAFKTTSQTSEFKFHKALANLQVAAIQAGNALMPFAVALTNAIGWLANAFSNLSPVMQKVIFGFLALLAAIGPAIAIGLRLYQMFKMLQVAMLFLAANPIVLIIAAIVALVLILIYAYKHSQTFRAIVQEAFHAVAHAAGAAVDFIKMVWGKIVDVITHPWRSLKSAAVGLFGFELAVHLAILHLIAQAASWALGIGESIVTGILNGADGLYDKLKSKLESTLKSALSSINPFSPVEHGGEMLIGRPIMEGAIKGVMGGRADLTSAINMAVRASVTGGGPSTNNKTVNINNQFHGVGQVNPKAVSAAISWDLRRAST